MKNIKIITIVVFLLVPLMVSAQGDCSKFFKFRKPEAPFEYNDLSKGAVCVTGETYEFKLPLTKGKDYRLKFYAAPVFNNKINFKIIDESSHEVILDLPGQSNSEQKGTCVLKDYYDEDSGKMEHPYFDFYPVSSTNLKIIIDVLSAPGQEKHDDPNFKAPEKKNRGCVTVVILDKPSLNSSF
ncbi:MAG: hypothetical protein U9N85_03455 [Bacteroidota bacterium]|nr:hypothetical protein [Bacteroidota bacterium]